MESFIFDAVFTAVGIFVYGYIGWRLIVSSKYGRFWKSILWSLLILFMVIPSVPFILSSNQIESLWVDIVTWIAYLSLGFFPIVFMSLLAKDIMYFIKNVTQKPYILMRRFFSIDTKEKEIKDPSRRLFLERSLNLGILCLSGALECYGVYEAKRCPAVVKVSVPFDNLPPELESLRIVQISDIHAGTTIKQDYIQTVVERVNSLAPDIIALTGDVADGSVRYLREHTSPLANLHARYGTYFVTGNHEYYSGAEAWIEEMDRIGFTVLMNEHRVIDHGTASLLLAGVTDYSAGDHISSHASNPIAALSGAPKCDLKVVLAHQPSSIFDVAQCGFDLQLSGHTHGGQSFPLQFMESLRPPHYVAGLYKLNNTWIYVNRGTGYWGPPQRISVRSEISMFKLTNA
ncbi:MAG: metallophosphoesterase [Candidatus Brocadiaceae bacterium]|nr:metallophosphoesterase [Candidatus Brocadiaceae bacterium]